MGTDDRADDRINISLWSSCCWKCFKCFKVFFFDMAQLRQCYRSFWHCLKRSLSTSHECSRADEKMDVPIDDNWHDFVGREACQLNVTSIESDNTARKWFPTAICSQAACRKVLYIGEAEQAARAVLDLGNLDKASTLPTELEPQ